MTTDRYPCVTPLAKPRRRCAPRLDPPPPIALDTAEHPRDRINRLALASARFVADHSNRRKESTP
jgi:hypothetical protein